MFNRIKELRESAGLTQQQLATRAGTSQPQIDRLEKSSRKLTQDWMNRLSRALGCEPQDLLPNSKGFSESELDAMSEALDQAISEKGITLNARARAALIDGFVAAMKRRGRPGRA